MVILPPEIVGFLKRVTSSRCVLGTVVASVLSAEVSEAEELLENYCYSCHDEWEQKGGLQLDELGQMPLESRLDVLNKVQEQLYLGQMPPKKKKKQPTEAERSKMLSWVAAELKKHNASTLEGKLRYPNYGNHVSHEKLFNGEIVAKPYTQARRWLVSPQIFIERINAVFGLEGGARQRSFYGVTIPVILPDHSGVRYYDTTTLDGGHLLMMLTNADWISEKQLREARIKNGEVKSNEFPNPKDRWSPRKTPEAFEFIVTKKSPPTEAEMKAAIHTQYQCVLQRDANKSELERHLKLLKESILLAGNTEGLRQMLVSVLLKSEFMYRYEFGAGEVDGAGRMKLSPREASYAIAYALSDRNPDADLLKTAKEGRLNTKEDYRREVSRMLNDKSSFAGPGAPEVSGKGLNSHKVSHPKINRFFREFFGYPNMTKVFKDTKRSGGFYSNAGRGTAGTSGHVIDEADKIVDHILRKDQNVFEQLLSVRHWGESSIGTWTLQVIDNFASDTGTLRSANLTLHGTQSRGYRSWVEENFTQAESRNNAISGELADPDLDGRDNLLEYAFAGDPKKPEATLPGEPRIIKSDGQSKVRFTQDLAKSDIRYSLTRSSNLAGNWLNSPTRTAFTNETFETRELILDPTQKQFFRIKISK
ncbi:DUF1592 domain-containing protein [Akkermansiaceae bacterium]|nr:DUF1592 domain-containing protein [Akkermansiaceae bacterium]